MLRKETATLQHLNILRVLAAFAVVFTHVSSTVLFSATPLSSLNWWVGNLFVSAARWCIPVFVMIGGALLLDPAKNETPMCFYKKRLRKILVPLVFWTLFYTAIRYDSGTLTLKEAIYNILRGEPFYHLWYLYMILGLYLLTPFLRTYVKYSTYKERNYLMIVIFVLANSYSVINTLFFRNQISVFTMFIPYLAYYLCGYQLRLLDPQKISVKYLAVAIIVCIFCTTTGTAILMKIFDLQKCQFLYNYMMPPTIVMSIAVFLIIYCRGYSILPAKWLSMKIVEQFAPTTLGIYLLHAVVLGITRKIIGQQTMNHYALLTIPAITLSIFLLCHVLVSIVMRIPFVRQTVACENTKAEKATNQ